MSPDWIEFGTTATPHGAITTQWPRESVATPATTAAINTCDPSDPGRLAADHVDVTLQCSGDFEHAE